jgi:serine/threonine protein kinase/Tfp pilus assembly protein PilF
MNCPKCSYSNPAGTLRCEKCGVLLSEETLLPTPSIDPRWSVAADVPAGRGEAPAPAVLHPGSLLADRYEILQHVGEGGMGAVYKATDRELDRIIALKVIRPELIGHAEILRRFKQEIILARKITHKNVIRIFDLGQAEGMKFITMEYVEGRDLKTLLCSEPRFSIDRSVSVIKQVCLALDAAHTEAVVHRDLKPSNIMLDSHDKVTVMDFGIAHSMEVTGMTRTGSVLGTPEYMSPEQAKGEEVDARSDLFSLGIIFYELLTGRSPYQAATSFGTLLKRTQEPARPPIELDQSIPKFMSDIVVRCLEIDPQRRYASAREILQDLEARHGPPKGVPAPGPPWFRAIRDLPMKWVAPGLALILLLVVGILFRDRIFAPAGKPKPAGPVVSLAILPFRNASGDPSLDWLGSSLAEWLSTDVGQSSSLRTVSSDRLHQILQDLRITADSNLDAGTLRRLAEFSNAQTVVWGQYVKLGEQIRIDATLRDLKQERTVALNAEAPNQTALPAAVDRLAQAIRKNLSLPASAVKELQAQAFIPTSQSLQALRNYNEGLQLLRQGKNLEAKIKFETATKEDREFALAYAKLAQTYANLGYESEAQQASRKAVDLSDKLPPQEKYRIAANDAQVRKDYPKAIESYENLVKVLPEDGEIQFTLGRLYEDAGSFDKAREHYGKVLERDPKSVDGLLYMGRVESQSGNPQGGLDYLNRALTLAIQVENVEEKATILHAIGIAYRMLNKQDEALRNYQESLTIKRRLGDKRGMAVSLNAIAQIQERLGQPDLALKSYEEALRLAREIGDRAGAGYTLIDLGGFYHDRGQHDQALTLQKEALLIQRELGNEVNQGLCLNNIGSSYFYKGQFEDAATYFQQALQLREKTKRPDEIAETVHNLGETSANMGQYDRALSYYLRALELYRGTGDKRGAAIESSSIGTLFLYQGRFGAAVSSKQDALKTFRELGDRSFWMVEILSSYGDALIQAGRTDESKSSLDEAMNLARELKNEAFVAQIINYQGDGAFYRGEYKSARDLYQRALQTASRAGDRGKVLQVRFDLARLAVKEGRHQAAISALEELSREADSLGWKYLVVECSAYKAEALMNVKDYARAQQELGRAITSGEKLGLRATLARSHFLLATILRLTGSASEAAAHYREAIRLLEEIRKEPGASNVLQRGDLNAIYTDSTRWSQGNRG